MKQIIYLTLFLCTGTLYAQNLDYHWATTIGSSFTDVATDIEVDATGNIYAVGMFNNTATFEPVSGTPTLSSNGQADIFIAKFNSNGSVQWVNQIGAGHGDEVNNIEIDATGNIYITGSFGGIVDFDPSAGVAELDEFEGGNNYFAKYDSEGNFIWAKNMGYAIQNDIDLDLDGSGNIYLSGSFDLTADFDPSENTVEHTDGGNSDVFLAKYDSDGNFLWVSPMTGAGFEQPYALSVSQTGEAYVTGYFYDTVDFDPSAGVHNETSNGNRDIFLAKYDASGNFLWVHAFGGENYDIGAAVNVDEVGNVYFAGNFTGTVDFDPSANEANLTAPGSNKAVFLAKYNAAGDYIWAGNLAGSFDNSGEAIDFDASGNVLLSGSFSGTADFDPSASTANMTTTDNPSPDVFVACYSADGIYQWAENIGSDGVDQANALAFDGISGDIYLAGYYKGEIDFDLASTTSIRVWNGYEDSFIARYSINNNGSVGMEPIAEINPLKIFPNPGNQQFTVQIDEPGARLILRDALGRIVEEKLVYNQTQIRFGADISPGVYLLQVYGLSGLIGTEKVIKTNK